MRLVSFSTADRKGVGLVTDNGIVDLGARLAGQRDLFEFLQSGEGSELDRFSGADADYRLDEVSLRPVIPNPAARFFCIGINYKPHMLEMGRDLPPHPVVFVRFASSLVGHGEAMVKPKVSDKYDFEGELAVIIGRPARAVKKEQAMDYVAGFSCFNDGSVRDFQRHSGQFTPGKNFDSSGAMGPWMSTVDEVADAADLTLTTRLNGEVVQQENTGELLFGISELIEYISIWTELQPGDVIATGTPGGVGAGRNPPLWMRSGDTIEVEITALGCLSNPIVEHDVD